ncbi:hypothetical protein [Paraburkholderia sp. J76]|uniref:hypothetical protein n=1 Tax=Paraburkholderia sp. J76 TaxID=2805439 RepID=UPI002ABD2315|nr:hypothetical protein [Paraburkholderia sp. J76]
MFPTTPDRSSQPRTPMLTRACDRMSVAGVYLLPPLYVGFAVMLFLLCRAPAGAFWLTAAAGVLAGAMGICSVAFYAASAARAAPLKPAIARATAFRGAGRPMPQRFVQMTTRPCSQQCGGADGARTRFTVSCFHAQCQAGGTAKEPR